MMPSPDLDPATAGPYATAAEMYWQAGWRGVLPLPVRAKKSPPEGYTGAAGAWPSYPDLYAWAEGREGAGNIALRLPHHVIGLDVDDYDGKGGGATLANLIAKYGELPPTWRSTSRDDGVSGIRLYRVPEHLAWPGDLRGGIEIIQHRHRYAVAWPSVHPSGRTYRWIDPDGNDTLGVVPPIDDLPDLPEAWVIGITGGLAEVDIPRADLDDAQAATWLDARGSGLPCRAVRAALTRALTDLATGTGARHDAALRGTQRLAHLAAEGHTGVSKALEALRGTFIQQLAATPDRTTDPGEWRRMLVGAIAIAAAANPDDPVGDPCDNPFHDLVDPGLLSPLREASPLPATSPASGGDVGEIPLGPAPSATSTQTSTEADAATEREIFRRQLLAQEIERQRAVRDARRHLDEEETAALAEQNPNRMVDGATFVLDVPDTVPTVWGSGDDVLWAEGESLMLVGPPGVGKTTLAGQIIRARLGLADTVLDLPVVPGAAKVLYLAMDRPAQAARALRRHFQPEDRGRLAEALVVWKGPPPADVAKNPLILAQLAQAAGADTIVIDSVKDAAVGLTEDEVAAGYNRARQEALTCGIEVLELHHLVKRGANGAKPNTLADVYGSAWITAGAGSVVLLWGSAGDPIVEWTHLKQPAAEVGPHRIIHDHDTGTSSIWHNTDLLAMARARGDLGITAKAAAAALFSSEKPSPAEIEKARRRLNRLTKDGRLTHHEGNEGAAIPAVWTLTPTLTDLIAESTTTVSTREGIREALTSGNVENVRVREGSRKAPSRAAPPLEGGCVSAGGAEGSEKGVADDDLDLLGGDPMTGGGVWFCRYCGAENEGGRALVMCTSCWRRPGDSR